MQDYHSIEEIINNDNFSENQKDIIIQAFDSGLDIEKIKIFAKPEFNTFQMQAFVLGFKYFNLTNENVYLINNPEIPFENMHAILIGLQNNADLNILEEIAGKKVSPYSLNFKKFV